MEEKIKYFTQEEMKKIFKNIDKTDSKHAIRDKAIFRVVYRCALRASEVGLIKLEDYNKSKGELYCRRLKGSQNNTIRLDEETVRVLNKYIREYELKNESQYLFISQENKPISRQSLDLLIKKYCRAAKINDTTKHHFHAIKHTAAIHLAESGLDIKDLQWWLGHKNVNNTEIYFRFTTTQQEHLYKKLQLNNSLV